MKHHLAILLCGAALACGDEDLLTPGEMRELAAAEQRWAARPFTDYSYQIRRLCFCAPEHNEWGTVEVRGGVVTAVRLPGDTLAMPANRLSEWPIVDSLFSTIRRVGLGSSRGVAEVDADFDATLGYPVAIAISPPDGVTDGGVRIEARFLNPLP